MSELGTYPFGAPLRRVEQADRSPKGVFVLGVYASAVHARWVDDAGRTLVRALAVASEPAIFWDGAGADAVVSALSVPPGAGRLVAADAAMNGPSGRTLDDEILGPLGLTRSDAWLCDLLPHTCLNPSQARAIDREYVPRMAVHGLPEVTLPSVPRTFADAARRAAIVDELETSKADVVVLLGDVPIAQFLAFHEPSRRRLSAFGDTDDEYGRLHDVHIGGRPYRVLPLVHPRQAAGLGRHSAEWRARHAAWTQRAGAILG